jgi:hypothetical protein
LMDTIEVKAIIRQRVRRTVKLRLIVVCFPDQLASKLLRSSLKTNLLIISPSLFD